MLLESKFNPKTDKFDFFLFQKFDFFLFRKSNSVSFKLKDVTIPNFDIIVTLDYTDGIKSNDFKSIEIIANQVKDFIANYPENSGDFFEVINRNLTQEILTDSSLGLSKVLDSLTVDFEFAPTNTFQFDSRNIRTPKNDLNDVVSYRAEDLTSPINGGIVADVTLNLDYIDGIDSSEFRDIIPVANFIEDFLANYPAEAGSNEVLNRDLAQGLFNEKNIAFSGVLDSLSVNLDIESKNNILSKFDTTTTITPNGNINDIVSFQLEDVKSPISGGIVADVTVSLDYIDGIDSSLFQDVIPIGNYIEDFLVNYSGKSDIYEVLNRDLSKELLNDSNLALSKVLDSVSVNLDVETEIIPFQFDTTITRTTSGDINDIVSFELEDISLPIDGVNVADITVNLDYIDGINPSRFKDVAPLGHFIQDYLTNYSNSNDSFEVVNNNLSIALLKDSNLGLSQVLDSLTVKLGASQDVIPVEFDSTVTLTSIDIKNFGVNEFIFGSSQLI